jgi:RimJ/RimL family protein N-acetyltransferase
MSEQYTPIESHGTIRKLWPTETAKFRDHLLRLDKTSRRMRFAHGVSDAFIEEYATRMADMGGIVYAYFEGDDVRAAAELKKLGDTWGREAEAAFSVEKPQQEHGIGTELMGLVIRAARNRGVQHLGISCLAENGKMRAIARRYEAELRFEYGEVIGEIIPQGPNYFSLLAEAVDDRFGYMMAVLDLHKRVVKAA